MFKVAQKHHLLLKTQRPNRGTWALVPCSQGSKEKGNMGMWGHSLCIGSCLFDGEKTFFMLMHRLRKESSAWIPSHHHTVHSGTDLNSCLLCAQTKRGRRQSRTPRFKQRPGEQTVFSVGRLGLSLNMSVQVLARLL